VKEKSVRTESPQRLENRTGVKRREEVSCSKFGLSGLHDGVIGLSDCDFQDGVVFF